MKNDRFLFYLISDYQHRWRSLSFQTMCTITNELKKGIREANKRMRMKKKDVPHRGWSSNANEIISFIYDQKQAVIEHIEIIISLHVLLSSS